MAQAETTSYARWRSSSLTLAWKSACQSRSTRRGHPKIGSVLGTGAGFGLMYLESEVMMCVLERLRAKEVVGLPVFDAVLVKASMADAARTVMKEEFEHQTGLEIQVRLEGDTQPEQAPVVERTPSSERALTYDDL